MAIDTQKLNDEIDRILDNAITEMIVAGMQCQAAAHRGAMIKLLGRLSGVTDPETLKLDITGYQRTLAAMLQEIG